MRSLVLLTLVAGVGLGAWAVRPYAQEVEPEEEATPAVRDAELQTYIAVYTAMQGDHGLTIENALLPHNMSLEDFRGLERRIQSEPRLVERVRTALREFVQTHSAYAQLMGTPTAPAAEPTPGRAGRRSRGPGSRGGGTR